MPMNFHTIPTGANVTVVAGDASVEATLVDATPAHLTLILGSGREVEVPTGRVQELIVNSSAVVHSALVGCGGAQRRGAITGETSRVDCPECLDRIAALRRVG